MPKKPNHTCVTCGATYYNCDGCASMVSSEAQSALKEMGNAYQEYMDNGTTYLEFSQKIEAQQSVLLSKGADYVSQQMGQKYLATEEFMAEARNLDTFISDVAGEDAITWAKQLTNSQRAYAKTLADGTTMTRAEFDKGFAEYTTKQAHSLQGLTDSYTELSKTQSDARAIADDANKTGSISMQQYKDLVALNERYAGAVKRGTQGRYTVDMDEFAKINEQMNHEQELRVEHGKALNQQEYEAAKQTLEKMRQARDKYSEEAIATQEAQVKALAEQSNGFNILTSNINAATSAYQRYQDAVNGGEEGDVFRNTKQMVDELIKSLDNHQTDTNKFRTGADYVLSKGRETDPKEMERVLKAYQGLFDKNGELSQSAAAKFFTQAGVMDKSKSGEYSFKAGMLAASTENKALDIMGMLMQIVNKAVQAAENDFYNKLITASERYANCMKYFDEMVATTGLALTQDQRKIVDTLIKAACEEMGHTLDVATLATEVPENVDLGVTKA